ncbi:MAG: ArnT family glycosyltransferase [Archangium sp.]
MFARLLRWRWIDSVAVLALIITALVRLAPGLDHQSIWNFDESFHQVVTRHVFEHPFEPMLHLDPSIGPTRDYMGVRIWLVKPPGAFWVGALMMHLVGPVPLAFRLGALFAQMISAVAVYLFARNAAGRLLAFIGAAWLLVLPSAWILTQGRFVSDVLEVELAGWICLAMLCLARGVSTGRLRWWLVAGAFTGGAMVTKGVLGMTPIGVAGLLWLFGLRGWAKRTSFIGVVAMIFVCLALAMPWSLYASHRWPQDFQLANQDVLMHLLPSHARAEAPQWIRPPDAIFNEVNVSLFGPLSHVLVLICGLWLAIRAVQRRETHVLICAMWLWATWLVHSIAAIKMYHHLWNIVPPGLVAVSLVLRDVRRSIPLLVTASVAASKPFIVTHVPVLTKLRELMPVGSQTKTVPGLAEVLPLVVVGFVIALVFRKLTWRRLPQWSVALAGGVAAIAFTWVMFPETVRAQDTHRDGSGEFNQTVYSRDPGLAIASRLRGNDVVWLDTDRQPYGQFENINLEFWSNAIVKGGHAPNPPATGWLVSPRAEKFEPLPVPANSWMRAYDLTKPLSDFAPLPEGLQPLTLKSGTMSVVGVASQAPAQSLSRYAFFVKPTEGRAEAMSVTFTLRDGTKVVKPVAPEAALLAAPYLAQSAWFVMPVLGPSRDDVARIAVGDGEFELISEVRR